VPDPAAEVASGALIAAPHLALHELAKAIGDRSLPGIAAMQIKGGACRATMDRRQRLIGSCGHGRGCEAIFLGSHCPSHRHRI
jgi:hypothetical protein